MKVLNLSKRTRLMLSVAIANNSGLTSYTHNLRGHDHDPRWVVAPLKKGFEDEFDSITGITVITSPKFTQYLIRTSYSLLKQNDQVFMPSCHTLSSDEYQVNKNWSNFAELKLFMYEMLQFSQIEQNLHKVYLILWKLNTKVYFNIKKVFLGEAAIGARPL